MSKVDGLMLDPDRVHTSEAQVVPAVVNGLLIPAWGGQWLPGVAKSFQELGVTKTDAMQAVKDGNLKLVPAKADPPPADFDPYGTIPDNVPPDEQTPPVSEPEPEPEPHEAGVAE